MNTFQQAAQAAVKELPKAFAPFINVLAICDALPESCRDDGQPLSHHIPGNWPTLGELRALVVAAHHTIDENTKLKQERDEARRELYEVKERLSKYERFGV